MQLLLAPVLRRPYVRLRQILFCALALLLFHSASSAAAEPPAPVLTLQQAFSRTLERNPSLRMFEFRQRVLDGRAQTAALNPAVNLNAELENFAGSDGFDNAELTVGLSSVIEFGDKREARTASVNSERALLEVSRRIQALDLLGEVTRRYVRVLAGTEQQVMAQDAVRLAMDTLNAVDMRVSAGGAPVAEKLRAEAALARAQIRLQRLQQQLRADRVALAAMWADTSTDFSVNGGALYRVGAKGDFEAFFQRVLAGPLVNRFASEERLRAAQLRLARTASRADLGWSLGVRRNQEVDSTSLVAGVSLPLFSAERARGAISAAEAQLDGVSVERQSAHLQLRTQLYRAFSTRAQAIGAVRRLRSEIIPALMRALQQTEQAYRNGRYGYQEWVAAREELLDARSALIREAENALLARAEIEQLTAASLDVMVVEK
ncbi:TolC family protein [Microbulbifer celer]|uniref:TolC family protein n=1 Tax=Microbulbifer celer TaxID=435905 RepID=A0ABW3UCN2_9GAMM|nr:TolC family protein [Microbulbifer celer]UFN56519.1 TolC family protein [Microbulbifer celer]